MRVLAITGNASLVVALGSMMRDWEVITVRSVEEATTVGSEARVALIDLGDTEAGVAVADELYRTGITIPSVVIGDAPAPDSRSSILVRPFSLEDLGAAVVAASNPVPAQNRVSKTDLRTPADTAREPTVPTAAPSSSQRQKSQAAPATQRTPPRRPLSVVPPEPEVVFEEPTQSEVEAHPEPAKPASPPAPAEPAAVASSAEPSRDEASEVERQPAEPQPVEPRAQAPAISESRPVEAREPPSAQPLSPQKPPPSLIAPSRAPSPASGPSAAATATAPAVEAPNQGRWRKRRRPSREETEPVAEAPLLRKLRKASIQIAEIEELLDELPVLHDLRTMADALAGEMETQFGAPVASVFVRGEDGYRPVAHRGLSRVEAGMVVPDTQPLFSDVLATREGILIQPVDLAQGLVAGIGGARTEAMMAAPALLGDVCVAIVVVGGDRFDEGDLDRLADLAAEAAPGLAVAQALQRLRGGA